MAANGMLLSAFTEVHIPDCYYGDGAKRMHMQYSSNLITYLVLVIIDAYGPKEIEFRKLKLYFRVGSELEAQMTLFDSLDPRASRAAVTGIASAEAWEPLDDVCPNMREDSSCRLPSGR